MGFPRAFLLASLVLSATFAAAQSPSVTEPPPPITFPAWKEEGRTATSVEYSVSFPSAMTTSTSENNTVPLRIFLPSQGTAPAPAPVVLVLHYLGARDLKVERTLAAKLNAKGIAAAVLTLPYHLSRLPKGASAGELAIASEPGALVATMGQSVLDARRSLDFLATRPEIDASRMGISGTSLGSIVSALVFAVDSRLHYASFVLGGVDLAHIIWTSSRVVSVREAMRRKGITEASLRTALATVEPRSYLAGRVDGTAFVIGARYDTVMPPADTEKLIASLREPKTLWLETGHYGGVFVQRKLLGEVTAFFEACFDNRLFEAPKHVFAPTVRLGLLASTGASSAFDVGIGLDLFRTHTKQELFATALITPRGPQAYLGWHIDKGFSIGGIASTRRVGLGIMWSTVL